MAANEVNKIRASDAMSLGKFRPNSGEGLAYGILYGDNHVWVANPGPGPNNVVTKIWAK